MSEDKLNKLKALLQAVNDGLSKEEFTSAFKAVVTQIKSLEAELIKTIGSRLSKADTEIADATSVLKELKQEFQQVVKETRDANETTFANVKKRTIEAIDTLFMKMRLNDKFSEIAGKHEQMMKSSDSRMKAEMGKMYQEHEAMMAEMPDTEKMMEEMMEKMPPETPESVRDKLESIQDEEQKLAISAIAHLEEKLKDLEKKVATQAGRPMGGFNYGSLSLHIVDDETPVGTIDGVNTAFTVNNPPSPVSSLKVFVNGQRLRITTDYTFSGNTITFITAPPTSSILLADYRI